MVTLLSLYSPLHLTRYAIFSCKIIIVPVMRAKEQQDRLGSDIISAYCTQTRKLFQLWDHLQVSKGILFCIFYSSDDSTTNTQLVVLNSLHSEVMEHIHADSGGGHLGQTKTLQKLKDRFYWPGHYNDVMRWCSTCPSCITRKSTTPKPKAPLLSISVVCPMQLVAVDLLGPLPQSPAGNSYILVAAEYFIKWSEVYPLPNMKAVTVAAALTNEMFSGFHLLKQYIQPVCFAYNTSIHTSTGFTPFCIMYGWEACLPVDL